MHNKSHVIYSKAGESQPSIEFNVVQVPAAAQGFACKPYNRKGIYKISIHHGHNKVYYGDKMIEFKEYAILFSRPNMVYRFEQIGNQYPGYLCVFTDEFFDQFANINNYPLFNPETAPLMEITASQMKYFTQIFQEMEQEMTLDFSYKYDMLRTKILQLVLDALKLRPVPHLKIRESNSATRITGYFNELLEGQFPISDQSYRMILRNPQEFADELSVHVNHLNRSLKQVTDKTTTQLIAYRMAKEAKILLQDTEWSIMEIAWSLRFEDLSHFIKFFKKNVSFTPSVFRKNLVV
ncbi:AraC family transcriptional regulator [Sinomicrobium pectinilyticum]|uniref:AraC family transcriptional regulator n=1 Tax=Sinomicrobium pectinilyticum TaxID=1084421 RepID=A0A3N0EQD2_SINP1|nr:helix-turn-helix domain-containing protein [Sinomicrobium pectinilyticum]RNL90128.1 AraC family transcriptional regulator [Sinomicrobium pectinilyticum]